MDRLVIQPYLAVLHHRVAYLRDGAQGGGLAGTVASKQGQDLTLADVETHPLYDVAFAVIGVQFPRREEGRVRALGLDGWALGCMPATECHISALPR